MADYTKQIFEMLGIESGEEFKFRLNDGKISNTSYKIDRDLDVLYSDCGDWYFCEGNVLRDILVGDYKIIKIPKLTETEQLAIDYARACGCKWIAKDKDKQIIACSCRPRKDETNDYWVCDGPSNVKLVLIELEISFIRWEDEEPYYIGD